MSNKAVIMARGLGSRMRKEADGVELSAQQAAAAERGVKAMIAIDRPFLDYVINELADAGVDQVCLIIGPEHDIMRDYYGSLDTERVTISFAVQAEPLGTANAVLAAEEFAGDDRVLVINSDNFYPAAALRDLLAVPGSGLVGFTQRGMIEQSNIPADRIAAFALVSRDEQSNMIDIFEKPDAETRARLADDALVSMNCWLCGPTIFEAAKQIGPSARGEYELPDAVRRAIELGDAYRVVVADCGVLDMSNRKDIASVAAALEGRDVHL